MARPILVVGAGFAGATYARVLADAGFDVHVIDRRSHLAGNAFDAVDANGIRVHRYGPHLFHSKNQAVADWLARFTDWVPYRHRVRALLPGGSMAPLPVNRTTIALVHGVTLNSAEETIAFLQRVSVPIEAPRNAAEYLLMQIGQELTDLFFRPYTRKMWGLELEDMDTSVVRRLPLRFDEEDAYFPDDGFQALPRGGYTALVERMLDHPRIKVTLRTSYTHDMKVAFLHCFNSMPIDEYFDFALGPLPYRSIRFHARTADAWDSRDWSVTNFTDAGPFTRETWWHCLPGHVVDERHRRTITLEEPCDDRDNDMERYYPVRTADNRYQRLYQDYVALSGREHAMTFIGRCGTYQYLDMDQVVNQSLSGAQRWIRALG